MQEKYISISQLTRYIKFKFDTDENLKRVYLKGEISNFKAHTRGHYYFTLKDESSRINAVMFSSSVSRIKFQPEDGMKVLTHFGTPIVPTNQLKADECYFLNTDDFAFYELGDWKWLEDESGRVLRASSTKPSYSATLVKYTELVCQKPNGVAYCKNIPTSIPSSSQE